MLHIWVSKYVGLTWDLLRFLKFQLQRVLLGKLNPHFYLRILISTIYWSAAPSSTFKQRKTDMFLTNKAGWWSVNKSTFLAKQIQYYENLFVSQKFSTYVSMEWGFVDPSVINKTFQLSIVARFDRCTKAQRCVTFGLTKNVDDVSLWYCIRTHFRDEKKQSTCTK